jgi:hypothetical protein
VSVGLLSFLSSVLFDLDIQHSSNLSNVLIIPRRVQIPRLAIRTALQRRLRRPPDLQLERRAQLAIVCL